MSYLLEGIKVIDLASFLAAPGAGTLMADYGAEVIKIEPPAGDGYRRLHGRHRTDYNWQLTSRNKKGVALDISKPEGREVLIKLLADADILLTNFRSDQQLRYQLSFADLKTQFPKLIYAQLTGYGLVGPEKERRGYDATAWWARSGIMQLMKKRGEPPVFPAGGVGDHASAMTLFAGIMMALYRRQTTGEGGFVSTSLIANGCWANGMALQGAAAGFDLAEFLESQNDRSPFAEVYETRDGRHVILVLTNPVKEWPELANALKHSEWLTDDRLQDMRSIMHHRSEVRELIAGVIQRMTLGDVCLSLDEFELTYGVIDGLSDVMKDAHLIEAGVVVPTQSQDPDFAWTIANPIRIEGEATRTISDPPSFGEHTIEVLQGAGFNEAEISALRDGRIVFSNA